MASAIQTHPNFKSVVGSVIDGEGIDYYVGEALQSQDTFDRRTTPWEMNDWNYEKLQDFEVTIVAFTILVLRVMAGTEIFILLVELNMKMVLLFTWRWLLAVTIRVSIVKVVASFLSVETPTLLCVRLLTVLKRKIP